jgi:maleate isomerase
VEGSVALPLQAASTNASVGVMREYAPSGLIGVAAPQANPTVEPEMARLVPRDFAVIATRLTGNPSTPQNKLVEYLDNLGNSLRAFDNAPLDIVGFACTGTSYLIGTEQEELRIAQFSRQFGYPIVTCAQAVRQALRHLGVDRISLIAPYPAWLAEASQKYWESSGLTVTSMSAVDLPSNDTRHVYGLGSVDVVEAARRMDMTSSGALLITGTGVPTLGAIKPVSAFYDRPILTSNLCLAWLMMRTLVPEKAQVWDQLLSPDQAGSELLRAM